MYQTYPICCKHCNSRLILSGWQVGIKCFKANFLPLSEDFNVARKTELNAPSPTLRWTWNRSFITGIEFLRFAQLSLSEMSKYILWTCSILLYNKDVIRI